MKNETIESTSEAPAEKRQGKTGVWTFVLKAPDGHIVAAAEWGTNYDFSAKEWNEFPLIP